MRLRYISDLHLEFLKPQQFKKFLYKFPLPKPSSNEVCILAGDIGNPYDSKYACFMNHISQHFTKTYVIAGNHEYYQKSKSMEETNEHLEEYFEQFDNISYLNNKYEIYQNHCFIGSTLWSKITNPAYEINDVYNIPNFDYIKYNRLNRMCVDFLEDAVAQNNNCVIVTHHIPSPNFIDIKYKKPSMLPYNQWFYSDMDAFIDANKDKIKCWIYGHTHTPALYNQSGVTFACNPIGYPNENPSSDLHKIIVLDNASDNNDDKQFVEEKDKEIEKPL
jgi:predicted phosphodiesterase